MTGEAILTVSAAVVGLTQIVKWSGLPDKWGPLAVLALSLLGTLLWGWSVGTYQRAETFAYFAGWIAVSTSAAGVFGFTRAAAGAVTRATPPPPGGAGSNSTVP